MANVNTTLEIDAKVLGAENVKRELSRINKLLGGDAKAANGIKEIQSALDGLNKALKSSSASSADLVFLLDALTKKKTALASLKNSLAEAAVASGQLSPGQVKDPINRAVAKDRVTQGLLQGALQGLGGPGNAAFMQRGIGGLAQAGAYAGTRILRGFGATVMDPARFPSALGGIPYIGRLAQGIVQPAYDLSNEGMNVRMGLQGALDSMGGFGGSLQNAQLASAQETLSDLYRRRDAERERLSYGVRGPGFQNQIDAALQGRRFRDDRLLTKEEASTIRGTLSGIGSAIESTRQRVANLQDETPREMFRREVSGAITPFGFNFNDMSSDIGRFFRSAGVGTDNPGAIGIAAALARQGVGFGESGTAMRGAGVAGADLRSVMQQVKDVSIGMNEPLVADMLSSAAKSLASIAQTGIVLDTNAIAGNMSALRSAGVSPQRLAQVSGQFTQGVSAFGDRGPQSADQVLLAMMEMNRLGLSGAEGYATTLENMRSGKIGPSTLTNFARGLREGTSPDYAKRAVRQSIQRAFGVTLGDKAIQGILDGTFQGSMLRSGGQDIMEAGLDRTGGLIREEAQVSARREISAQRVAELAVLNREAANIIATSITDTLGPYLIELSTGLKDLTTFLASGLSR